MAMSTDFNLQEIIPDIFDFGIDHFLEEHAKAQADVEREIRHRWWPRRGLSGEMDTSKLTQSQWTRTAAYLIVEIRAAAAYKLVDNDRFLGMIDFYKARYGEELEAVFADGVEYDADGDGNARQRKSCASNQ